MTARSKLNFSITINSNIQNVWHTMLDHPTYEEWTSEFEPTSTYIGSWDKGANIKFVSDDNWGGMEGIIKENREFEYISIEYTGVLRDGVKYLLSPANETIVGAHENYAFEKIDESVTILKIEMETSVEFSKYLEETWPKALEVLKKICEK
jgi:hypothetical protein